MRVPRTSGTRSATAIAATAEKPAIIAKVARQPQALPTTAPSGTPTMLATPMPPTTIESAVARRSTGTLEVASTMARPKKVPCAAAATMRAAINAAKLGAIAQATCAARNSRMTQISAGLRG